MDQKQIRARLEAINRAKNEAIDAVRRQVNANHAPEVESLRSECAVAGHMFIAQGGWSYAMARTCAFCHSPEPLTEKAKVSDAQ
jgi:hypothetical protein